MAKLAVVPSYGVAEGVDLDNAPHRIPEGKGRYLQDVLLDTPGIVRQRGSLDALGGANPVFPSLPSNFRVIGMTSLADPNNVDAYRVLLMGASYVDGTLHAIIYGRGSAVAGIRFDANDFFELENATQINIGEHAEDPYVYVDGRRFQSLTIGAKLVDIPMDTNIQIPASAADPFFDAKMCSDGGILMGVGMFYGGDVNNSSHRGLFHWRGAAKADYTAGTIALTATSKTVTGTGTSFVGNIEPGMFVMTTAPSKTFGVVASVTDNTHLQLEQNALTGGASGTYVISSIRRPFYSSFVNVGNITASASSTVINGGNTKFVDQGVANGDFVFKNADQTFIGTVSTIQSNTQLTLGANALLGMANEDYLISRGLPWSTGQEPVFTAYWNGMQLAGNADFRRSGISERSRIFVLGPSRIEAVDVTKDGSFYDLPTTKPHSDLRGMMPTEAACLVFLAESTYGLTGNTPETLSPKVILDDGCLSPMAVQPWQGGAVWVGHRSVYLYDGANTRDLLAGRAQRAHRQAIANIDYSQFRAWSMIHDGHFICFIQKVAPDIFSYTQGGSTTRPESIIYNINLATGALVFWTNIAVRGYTSPPGKLVSTRDAFFVVENSATTGPTICSAEALFADSFIQNKFKDDVIANPTRYAYAPHFYVEGRLNDFGDPERLKVFKQLQMQYLTIGDTNAMLGLDIITGLSHDTIALTPKPRTSSTASTQTWKNRRTRFLARSTHAAARFYTTPDLIPSIVQLGAWGIGMKLQRMGRV